PADEHQAVHPLLLQAPGAARPPLEIPVHALQQELVVVAFQAQYAFQTQELVAHLADDRTEPHAHLQAVELAGPLDAYGVDVPQMRIALMTVVVVMMIMTMIVVVMVMLIVTLEFPREIDLAEVENAAEVDVGVLCPLDRSDPVEPGNLLLRLV